MRMRRIATAIACCYWIGSVFGHDNNNHLRSAQEREDDEPSRRRRQQQLEDVIASLVTRMEAMEVEIAELKQQSQQQQQEQERQLQNTNNDCGFVLQDDETCKLTRTLVLESENPSPSRRDVSLEVKGITLLENEVEILGDVTFIGNTKFEGIHNDVEVQGDLAVIGNLDVFGYTNMYADVTVERYKSGGKPNLNIRTGARPEVTIEGELTVVYDVTMEDKLEVQGDASFSEDVSVSGNCLGC